MASKINSNMKLSKLESIRGFAALYVVFHHLFASKLIICGYNFSFLFRFGQEAVILFFILSGFVISYSYQRSSDKSVKLFISKRFLRIYIPLLFVFATNYLLSCYQKGFFFKFNWAEFLGNIFMLQDYVDRKPNVLTAPFLDNLPLWSLSYEWWFYVLFIIIYKKVTLNKSVLVYIVGILSAMSYIVYPNFINRELMYFVIWWVGADIASLYLNSVSLHYKNLKLPLLSVGLVTLILFFNIYYHGFLTTKNIGSLLGSNPWLEFRHFLFTFIIIVIALIWKQLKWFAFDYTFGLFEPIASISFGIYISHFFLVVQATYLDGVLSNSFLKYSIYFIVCLLYSYLIERVVYMKIYTLFLKKK